MGIVKFWDVRKVACIETHDFGPYSANSVTFSPLSTMIVAASDDGSIKSYNLQSNHVSNMKFLFFKNLYKIELKT